MVLGLSDILRFWNHTICQSPPVLCSIALIRSDIEKGRRKCRSQSASSFRRLAWCQKARLLPRLGKTKSAVEEGLASGVLMDAPPPDLLQEV